MLFLRRRTTTEDLIPQAESSDNTYLARLAKEEALDDWRNKSRHEKLRLARIEMRRRKSEREGGLWSKKIWSKELLFLSALAFLTLLALLYLLHHRSLYRKRTGHEETWLNAVEDVLGLS